MLRYNFPEIRDLFESELPPSDEQVRDALKFYTREFNITPQLTFVAIFKLIELAYSFVEQELDDLNLLKTSYYADPDFTEEESRKINNLIGLCSNCGKANQRLVVCSTDDPKEMLCTEQKCGGQYVTWNRGAYHKITFLRPSLIILTVDDYVTGLRNRRNTNWKPKEVTADKDTFAEIDDITFEKIVKRAGNERRSYGLDVKVNLESVDEKYVVQVADNAQNAVLDINIDTSNPVVKYTAEEIQSLISRPVNSVSTFSPGVSSKGMIRSILGLITAVSGFLVMILLRDGLPLPPPIVPIVRTVQTMPPVPQVGRTSWERPPENRFTLPEHDQPLFLNDVPSHVYYNDDPGRVVAQRARISREENREERRRSRASTLLVALTQAGLVAVTSLPPEPSV